MIDLENRLGMGSGQRQKIGTWAGVSVNVRVVFEIEGVARI